jgi:hypothetical protein
MSHGLVSLLVKIVYEFQVWCVTVMLRKKVMHIVIDSL